MSIYSGIKFSNNLIEGKNTEVTYSGKLFQSGSNSVSIVYGFGDLWNFTTEQIMNKTEEGFKAKLKLYNYGSMNFCFKNSNNEWDNNNNSDYSVELEKEEPKFILNTDFSSQLLDNIINCDLSNISSAHSVAASKVTVVPAKELTRYTKVNSSVQTITPFFCEVEKNEPVNIESSIGEVTDAVSLNHTIENVFNDIYDSESDVAASDELYTPIEEKTNYQKIANFDMDSLIDDILSPIIESKNFEEQSEDVIQESNVQNIEINEPILENNIVENIEVSDNVHEINEIVEDSTDNVELLEIYDSISDASESIEEVEAFESTEDVSNFFSKLVDESIKQNDVTTEKFEEIDATIETNENLTLSIEDNETNLLEEATSDDGTLYMEESSDIPEDHFLISPRSLGKFYMFKKRMKLAFNKLFFALPRFLAKRSNENDNN